MRLLEGTSWNVNQTIVETVMQTSFREAVFVNMISPSLFSQTLCILANIADGTTAKEFIMTNDDILQKIKYYMVCNVFHEFFSYQKAFMEGP